MTTVIDLDDSTFDEVVRGSDIPVLVDFTAAWCGPCRLIAPILDEIATEQAGKLLVVKVDVDTNPHTVLRWDIMSMPTLLVFVDGEPQLRLVGATGKHNLLEHLAPFI